MHNRLHKNLNTPVFTCCNMKRTTILSLVLFSFIVLILTSGLLSGASINQNENKICLKGCLNKKIEDKRICVANSIDGFKECSEKYNICLNENKDNMSQRSLNRFCRQKYSMCNKGVINLKNSCKKEALLNYEKCVKNCNNQTNQFCTQEYNPICGMITLCPPCGRDGVDGNFSCNYFAPCRAIEKTFPNICELKKANATLLYEGECKTEPDIVKEQVKCDFANSNEINKCYTSDGKFSCSGNESCVAEVHGKKGEVLKWGSSCGDIIHETIIDGNDESLQFECPIQPIQICPDVYQPVCGELIVCPVCEEGQFCKLLAPCQAIEKTFPNICELKKANATLLYEGECREIL